MKTLKIEGNFPKFLENRWKSQFFKAAWNYTQSLPSPYPRSLRTHHDLPLALEKCRGKFGDAIYHKDQKLQFIKIGWNFTQAALLHPPPTWMAPTPSRPSSGPRGVPWKVWWPSYHRDRMHKEPTDRQTNKQTNILLYIYRFSRSETWNNALLPNWLSDLFENLMKTSKVAGSVVNMMQSDFLKSR